jgi:hypothetical protein
MNHTHKHLVPVAIADLKRDLAGLTPAQAAAFQTICVHNWERGEPVSWDNLPVLLSSTPEESDRMSNLLMKAGRIEGAGRGVWSPRALNEGRAAQTFSGELSSVGPVPAVAPIPVIKKDPNASPAKGRRSVASAQSGTVPPHEEPGLFTK